MFGSGPCPVLSGKSKRGEDGGGGKKSIFTIIIVIIIVVNPLLKNSLPSRSLLSLDLSSKSLMFGALSKNLLRSFFLPMSTSRIKEPITGFCASKCFTSLNRSSIGFWFLIMLFEMGSSFPLKLASFSLLLVTHRSISPRISSPNSLVARRHFFTSRWVCFLRASAESQSLEKNLYHQANPCKRTLQNC